MDNYTVLFMDDRIGIRLRYAAIELYGVSKETLESLGGISQ